MDNNALHMAITTTCPIDGVAVVDPSDKATWRIDFKEEATPEQRAAAQAIVDKFDVNAKPRRLVAKSLVISRLTDAQLDAALGAMTNRQKERWRSPDHPAVFFDDAETIALLKAIGADPAVILAE